MVKFLIDLLAEPSLKNMDIYGQERLTLHRKILVRKRLLREVFLEFHTLFYELNTKFLTANGLQIELGAGVSPIRDSYPEILSTDIIASPALDRTLDAEAMDAEQKVGLIMCSRSFFLNEGSLNESEMLLERGHSSSLI